MNQTQQSPAVTALLRVLAGIGGAIILLTFALFTLGAGLGAPIGIAVARRRARRRDRPFTRAASWFAAVVASIITAGLVLVTVFALAPTSPLREFQNGAIQAQAAQDTATTPAWLKKAFPQTARSDSAAKQMMKSPGFLAAMLSVGLLFTCIFLGAIGGSGGWLGSVLLGYALWGRAFTG